MRYELLWRNKYLTTHVTTLDEMVVALADAAAELQAISGTGKVSLDPDGISDDCAVLVTSDAEVAKQYNFEPVEEDNEFEDDEE